MPDNELDTLLKDNPEAAVFAGAIRGHKALMGQHEQATNAFDAVAALVVTVNAKVEQTFAEQHPQARALQRWVLALFDRSRVQVEAAGQTRQ